MISPIVRRSVLAGVLIAMGCMFSMAAAPYGPVVQGLCFSVGLFGVLSCGAKLFTGRILAIMSVWRGSVSLSDVARLWWVIWAWNLAGALCVAFMARELHFDAMSISLAKAALPWHELVIRAALCNVMVCMAVWVHGFDRARPIDALAACVLPVACFVTCGFEHSVADMLYMPLGLMQGAVDVWQCIYVIGLATVGNVLGGVTFARLVWDGGTK